MAIGLRVALCLLLAGSASLRAQAVPSTGAPQADLAVTFIGEMSLKAGTTNSFWMMGGSAEIGFNLFHGLGLAGAYSGVHTGSIGGTGVPLTLSIMSVGPRYRWHGNRKISIYGEGLVGVASGTNSVFPTSTGVVPNASSFAQAVNVGLDYRLNRRFAVRALDVGYLRTTLPNSTNNDQNTLRVGAGLVVRFGN